MTELKYELIEDQTVTMQDDVLYHIKALKNFGDVKKGDIGGYISKDSLLSHKGNCWIYDDAIVLSGSRLYDNAKVYNSAVVSDSYIINNGVVCDNSKVSGSIIKDNVIIKGESEILHLSVGGDEIINTHNKS